MTYLSIQNKLQLLFDKYYWDEFVVEQALDNQKLETVIQLFQYDYNRYFDGNINIDLVFSRIELIGIFLYRIAREFYLKGHELMANHFSNVGRLVSGFEIYYSATIGKGLKINHGLGTVIGARCTIGDNALIHQGVTLGDRNGARPTLLNNITVYAGAKILGGIVLGNNSVVAANTVCLTDVPDGSVVIGIPGKIKK